MFLFPDFRQRIFYSCVVRNVVLFCTIFLGTKELQGFKQYIVRVKKLVFLSMCQFFKNNYSRDFDLNFIMNSNIKLYIFYSYLFLFSLIYNFLQLSSDLSLWTRLNTYYGNHLKLVSLQIQEFGCLRILYQVTKVTMKGAIQLQLRPNIC